MFICVHALVCLHACVCVFARAHACVKNRTRYNKWTPFSKGLTKTCVTLNCGNSALDFWGKHRREYHRHAANVNKGGSMNSRQIPNVERLRLRLIVFSQLRLRRKKIYSFHVASVDDFQCCLFCIICMRLILRHFASFICPVTNSNFVKGIYHLFGHIP